MGKNVELSWVRIWYEQPSVVTRVKMDAFEVVYTEMVLQPCVMKR